MFSWEANIMLATRQRGLSTIAVVFSLLAVGVLLGGCGINTIPTLQEQAKASWSEVLNQYQRRADLIPNLVETVKGYAAQESKVLTEVTEARAKATQVQIPPDILTNPEAFQKFQEAQGTLTGALSKLLAITENYPDLKSNQNFLTLQSQLEGTENRIAIARRDYIQAVQAYNTELRTIPGRWWRAILYPDAQPMQNFTVAEETTKAPEVKF
jgi:LemA protein